MDNKLLSLCNEILKYLYRMMENENENKLSTAEISFYFCVKVYDQQEVYEQEEIDQAINELIRRGLIEKQDDFYHSLYPGEII